MDSRRCGALIVVAVIFLIIGIAIEKEAYSVTKRETRIEEYIDEARRGSRPACEVLRDILHFSDTQVVWRGCAIGAFVIAVMGSVLTCLVPCPPPLAVFISMFFISLSAFYLKAGHDNCHGAGYVHTAIHNSARALCGKETTESAFKRRIL